MCETFNEQLVAVRAGFVAEINKRFCSFPLQFHRQNGNISEFRNVTGQSADSLRFFGKTLSPIKLLCTIFSHIFGATISLACANCALQLTVTYQEHFFSDVATASEDKFHMDNKLDSKTTL